MTTFWRRAGLLILLLLALAGCSSVHVDVSRDLDWDQIGSVALETPTSDPWQLTPLITEELRHQGFNVISADRQSVNLLLRYQTREKPDLDAEGNLSERLESVHLQFLDPVTDKSRAVIDYFYPTADSSHSIADGIEEALAGLRSARPAQKSVSKQADTPLDTPSKPAASVKLKPEDRDAPTLAEQPTELPPETHTNHPDPATFSHTVSKTSAEKTLNEEPQPQIRSPWVPRFHSWGFDDWMTSEDDGFSY